MELAYLFWHCRRHSVSDENYRQSLASFHDILAQNPPPGFVYSLSRRNSKVPWLESSVEVYEDWYIVEDFTALGYLNANAAKDIMEHSHESMAKMVDQGAGGVYKLWFNHGTEEEMKSVVWFDQPPLKKTDDFLESIDEKAHEVGGVVWRRQLNLGPAKEYVIWLPAGKPFLVENSIQFPFNRI